MIIGVDTVTLGGTTYLGFAASINPQCSEYFTRAPALTGSPETESVRTSRLQVLSQLIAEALSEFADRNGGVLPSNILVYRGSTRLADIPRINEEEVQTILDAAKGVDCQDKSKTNKVTYEPNVTMVAVAKGCSMRFYTTGEADPGKPIPTINPKAGTLVDGKVTYGDIYNFYLISQHVSSASKGSSRPGHYLVTYDTAKWAPQSLHYITYQLCFMYYNHPGSTRYPAPLMYARRVANFCGSNIKGPVNERLQGSFYYL
jgi:hypothetical protein